MFGLFGKKKPEPAPDRDKSRWLHSYTRAIRAKYDSAQTTIENERYWAMADGRSARAALDPSIREKIRQRARYEALESGSFAKGMVAAKVNDVVGRGPQLQVQTPNAELNRAIESAWAAWSKEINLPAKLRTMATAYYVDGEAFAERISNPNLLGEIKLDLRLSEADLWTNPTGISSLNEVDGIRYDDSGVPVSYDRLRMHPGDDFADGSVSPTETDTIPAENVIHWFRVERPDQRRGVSALATALPLFAELRRYRLATIAAAEIAADYSAVMYSDASAFSENPDEVDENFLTIDIERRAMLTLPAGWKLAQLKAEQPTTQFGSFSEHILMEIGRCLHTPLNYLLYWNQNDVDRSDCELVVLERIFRWWLDEALLVNGLIPPLGELRTVDHRFVFPPRRPVDPESQAATDEKYLALGLMTDEQWATREAVDLEAHYDQLARMKEAREKLGLTMPGAPMPMVQQPSQADTNDPNAPPKADAPKDTPNEPQAPASQARRRQRA
jgi:capsid protein